MEKTHRKMVFPEWERVKFRLLAAGFKSPAYLNISALHTHCTVAESALFRGGRGAVVAAFPYFVPPTEEVRGRGVIAPFAGSNYYKEAVRRLKVIVRDLFLPAGWTKQDISIFSNSRLPEKLMAAVSGLGFYGRNSLVIRRGLGSWFIIAGFTLSEEMDWPVNRKPVAEPGEECGLCTRCVDHCPTGAIELNGAINRDRCLQHLSTSFVVLSERIMDQWGAMIYGCQLCQIICPFNRSIETSVHEDITGHIGGSLSLRMLLEMGGEPEMLKAKLKGTSLGMGWMNPLCFVRNAILAAGSQGDSSLLPLVHEYLKHKEAPLSAAARWAVSRLESEN